MRCRQARAVPPYGTGSGAGGRDYLAEEEQAHGGQHADPDPQEDERPPFTLHTLAHGDRGGPDPGDAGEDQPQRPDTQLQDALSRDGEKDAPKDDEAGHDKEFDSTHRQVTSAHSHLTPARSREKEWRQHRQTGGSSTPR